MIKISRVVHGIFAFVFFMAIVSVVLRGFIKYDSFGIIIALLCGALLTAFVVWLYGFLDRRIKDISEHKADKIFIVIALVVLLLQIIFAVMLKSEPINDLSYIDNAARDFSKSWDKNDLYLHLPERHQGYFARYPNNHAILIIISVIYFITDRLFGVTPIWAPIIVNILGLFLSYVLMYLISKKLFKSKTISLYTAILGAGFCVFYTYTPYYYTDSLSMPFVMGSIYLFLCGFESVKKKYIVIDLMFSMLLLVLGYKIKGSVIILLPAFLIYIIYFTRKYNLKRHLKQIGVMLVGFAVSIALSAGIINAFHITDAEETDNMKFPLAHWVMMGLHDRGGYYDKDFWFTELSGDYEDKQNADVDKIKERIEDYGMGGMFVHLAKKISYTWGDGSYFISRYVKNGEDNFLRSFVVESNAFKLYFCSYHFVMLMMILLSFIIGMLSKQSGKDILIRIIICGVFIFFVLWEARSRYLVNFSPLFVIVAASTAKQIYFEMKKRKQDKKIDVLTAEQKL